MICVENQISISVNHDDTALIYVPSQSISQNDQNGIYISGESGRIYGVMLLWEGLDAPLMNLNAKRAQVRSERWLCSVLWILQLDYTHRWTRLVCCGFLVCRWRVNAEAMANMVLLYTRMFEEERMSRWWLLNPHGNEHSWLCLLTDRSQQSLPAHPTLLSHPLTALSHVSAIASPFAFHRHQISPWA